VNIAPYAFSLDRAFQVVDTTSTVTEKVAIARTRLVEMGPLIAVSGARSIGATTLTKRVRLKTPPTVLGH
jgi:hypothetical protein